MSKRYAILPCNGLDKCAGCISREIALLLSEQGESQIICPVFYRTVGKYNHQAQELPLLVIDGCGTRCASKLAAEKHLKIAEKIIVADEAKATGVELTKGLRLGEAEKRIAGQIAARLLAEPEASSAASTDAGLLFPETLDYEIHQKDKFIFRVPKNEGFYFSENDVWVYIFGNRARIGVTDFVQKSLSDIMFFTPASVGAEIEQFDGAGEIESGKAVFELICPVGGVITAVNEKLTEQPELVNENPYEQGWIAELELSDFESDRELLLGIEGYLPIMKRKVDAYHV